MSEIAVYNSSQSCQPERCLIGKPGMRNAAASGTLRLVTVILLQPLVYASQKTYQAGKLLSVESPEESIPIPVGDGQTINWPIALQLQIRSAKGRQGLPIRGQRADLILPCVTKEKLGSIIKDFAKGDTERTGRALSALKRAEMVRLMLTTEGATREKD